MPFGVNGYNMLYAQLSPLPQVLTPGGLSPMFTMGASIPKTKNASKDAVKKPKIHNKGATKRKGSKASRVSIRPTEPLSYTLDSTKALHMDDLDEDDVLASVMTVALTTVTTAIRNMQDMVKSRGSTDETERKAVLVQVGRLVGLGIICHQVLLV